MPDDRSARVATSSSEFPRRAILDAAERSIARYGIEVPLRDIAKAAGNRNNSAVHYFFGSRSGLIEAMVERRTAEIETIRLDLLAQHEAAGTAHDAHALVGILVKPLLGLSLTETGSHYCRFLDIVRSHPALPKAANLDGSRRAAVRIVITRLESALDDMSPQRRRTRLIAMATAMYGLLADHERDVEQGIALPTAADDIVDMLVGLLSARGR